MTDVSTGEQLSAASAAAASAPSSLSSRPVSPAPPSSSSASSTAPPSPSSASALPPFSSALFDVLSPALSSCDSAISSVFASQDALAAQIDTLSALLASFHSLNQSAQFAPYTAKLQSAKKRIKRLQLHVDRINERMDDMREMIRRKEGIDGYSNLPTPTIDLQAGLTSLTRLTEKVASSFASMTQPRGPAALQSRAEMDADEAAQSTRAASDPAYEPAVDGPSSLPTADGAPPAPTATIAGNNALLHDLLAWDE